MRALDAEELVINVLPRCQTLPNLYNLIAKLTKSIQHEAEALEKNYLPPYESLPKSTFIMHIPGSSRCDSSQMRKDVELLSDLRNMQSRPYVIRKLEKLRMALERTIRLEERNDRETALRHAKELPILLSTMTSLLPQLQDRPYLYNKVAAHIKMAVAQIDGSCHRLLRLKHAIMPVVVPQEIKQADEETSHDRWEDVGRLDEILDYVEEDTFAYLTFQAMKNSCEMDARILQQLETGQGDKNKLNEAALGHFEEVRLS